MEKTERQKKFSEIMDNVDLARAVRMRGRVREGQVARLMVQAGGRLLAARISTPDIDTVEALGQSRCLAIDSATRMILDIIHRQAAGGRVQVS